MRICIFSMCKYDPQIKTWSFCIYRCTLSVQQNQIFEQIRPSHHLFEKKDRAKVVRRQTPSFVNRIGLTKSQPNDVEPMFIGPRRGPTTTTRTTTTTRGRMRRRWTNDNDDDVDDDNDDDKDDDDDAEGGDRSNGTVVGRDDGGASRLRTWPARPSPFRGSRGSRARRGTCARRAS